MRPIPAEEFSTLVGSIYDCALDPAGWSAVLEELARRMDFRTASLILATTPAGGALPLLDVTTGITAEERVAMLSHGQAAIDAWGPPGIFATLPLETPIVRSHVLRLFEKTGTHRQADLVGLLASFTLPLA